MSEKKEAEAKQTLRISDIDMKFKREVQKIHGGERMMMCFQCGTCTADCPIARFSDTYRPRKLLRMAQLGLKDRVLSSDQLWLCAACYTCVDHCPQDVEISSVIRALRNMAVQEGHMPFVFKELAGAILESGLAYKIPELRLRRRQEVGLPPLPKASVDSVAKLINQTGFQKLIEKGGSK
ncbi:MAG TPA: 4Fe-4S dicluster domain-containing protein [Candidatus Bathyarchaeia archaeon]|nr:4Fe-4S dicluster domain-containing protein [Candidatus Bathyarchaeia archaeon]